MLLKDMMSKAVVTVEPDDTLALVKQMFHLGKFHHVLVMEQGQLTGVVSDRDLYKALSPNIDTPAESYKDAVTLNKTVREIMSRQPIVLKDDATLDDAIDIFNAHMISCIPIVTQQGKLLGILSWRDILRNLRSLEKR
ncbi:MULTISPECIES: CBS domain-containing protein [unclassified Duganella]|jgi:acetoin utilization protein AcuB|uniref:CBS domain-containing protein n=1 Tax=unclassified Duganella TaxID=2636909 RepID=UPI000887B238|nr:MULTISPECIES: CBS domain-containing protein [unclassified Duganella]SDF57940.1 acetoin utilization protein AcuB [Duganella sp. OV458]SDI70592.1 acetoin utilization protein AcuB [Duganella sp. OV510]